MVLIFMHLTCHRTIFLPKVLNNKVITVCMQPSWIATHLRFFLHQISPLPPNNFFLANMCIIGSISGLSTQQYNLGFLTVVDSYIEHFFLIWTLKNTRWPPKKWFGTYFCISSTKTYYKSLYSSTEFRGLITVLHRFCLS